jgi:ataxin-3
MSKPKENSTVWIYHELQESALCGQHCLNNLLQDPVFTAPELADIAHNLDAEEQSYMLEKGAHTRDALKYLAESSGNVDASGNFSIQVLKVALQSFGLELEPWSLDKGDPCSETGFIVNRSSHWFALRKINGHWWDLNSTSTAPQYISNFYLAAFLSQLTQDGYSVFAAKGVFVEKRPFGMTSQQYWHKEIDILPRNAVPEKPAPFQGVGRKLGGTNSTTEPSKSSNEPMDDDLALAIALSMSSSESSTSSSHPQKATSTMSEKELMRQKRLAALEGRK